MQKKINHKKKQTKNPPKLKRKKNPTGEFFHVFVRILFHFDLYKTCYVPLDILVCDDYIPLDILVCSELKSAISVQKH